MTVIGPQDYTPIGYQGAAQHTYTTACDGFHEPGRCASTLTLSQLTLDAIQAEATRAHLKHGDYSMLGSRYSQSDRLAILTEEVGEVAHELTNDQGGPGVGRYDRDNLVKELVQVAAMAASWIEHLEGTA